MKHWLQYPHVFDEPVLEKIKGWVMDDTTRFSGEDFNWKHDLGKREASDSEMLKTYSTGLLAICLARYDPALFHFIISFGLC